MTCCPRPRRVPGPVDKALPRNLRLRHLPGEICLACHDVTAPPVQASSELDQEIRKCLAGTAPALTVLKVRPGTTKSRLRQETVRADTAAASQPCPNCAGATEPTVLDLALGESAGLVVEGTAGTVCWCCDTILVPAEGSELRDRLATLDLDAGGACLPSLLYDTPGHPTSLQLEVTTRCNLSCAYCSNRLLARREDVPFDRIKGWLDQVDLRHVDDVDFTGLGEPSLHRDLPRIIGEVRSHGDPTEIRMVSNGVALTEKRFGPLCDAGLTSISISVDSLDPERFARSRSEADLDRVLGNVEALVAYRDRHHLDHLRIKLKAVLLDQPYADAEPLLEYSARLGLDMPHFSCLDSRGSAKAMYDQPWLHDDWSSEGSPVFLTWARARWAELGPHREPPPAHLPPTLAQRTGGVTHPLLRPPADVCRWAVDAAFIAASGGALSCCEQMIDVPRVEWGTLRTMRLADLWTGPLLWGYRLPLTLGVTPAPCVGCSWAPRDREASRVTVEADPRTGPTNRST
jgi:organic radical activating enzyme